MTQNVIQHHQATSIQPMDAPMGLVATLNASVAHYGWTSVQVKTQSLRCLRRQKLCLIHQWRKLDGIGGSPHNGRRK